VAEQSLMLKLTRTNGQTVYINGSLIVSCEQIEDNERDKHHTVIVTSGDNGDVYHVRESEEHVTSLMRELLDDVINHRLSLIEADPRLAGRFREALERLSRKSTMYYSDPRVQLKMEVIKKYQEMASDYNLERIAREQMSE